MRDATASSDDTAVTPESAESTAGNRDAGDPVSAETVRQQRQSDPTSDVPQQTAGPTAMPVAPAKAAPSAALAAKFGVPLSIRLDETAGPAGSRIRSLFEAVPADPTGAKPHLELPAPEPAPEPEQSQEPEQPVAKAPDEPEIKPEAAVRPEPEAAPEPAPAEPEPTPEPEQPAPTFGRAAVAAQPEQPADRVEPKPEPKPAAPEPKPLSKLDMFAPPAEPEQPREEKAEPEPAPKAEAPMPEPAKPVPASSASEIVDIAAVLAAMPKFQDDKPLFTLRETERTPVEPEQPKTVVEPVEPAVEQPKPVAEQPKPVVERPEPVADEQPKTIVPQSGAVSLGAETRQQPEESERTQLLPKITDVEPKATEKIEAKAAPKAESPEPKAAEQQPEASTERTPKPSGYVEPATVRMSFPKLTRPANPPIAQPAQAQNQAQQTQNQGAQGTQFLRPVSAAPQQAPSTPWSGNGNGQQYNGNGQQNSWNTPAYQGGYPAADTGAPTAISQPDAFPMDPAGEKAAKKSFKRPVLIGAIAAGVLVAGYLADVLFSQGLVPRGSVVAGVDIGGLDRTAAEKKLTDSFQDKITKPFPIEAGPAKATIDPVKAGLEVNLPATVEQTGEQSWNPWTRIVSLFGSDDYGVVSKANEKGLADQLEALRPQADQGATEGNIRFEGTKPVAVEPKHGERLDVAKSGESIKAQWVSGDPVKLTLDDAPVKTTSEGVHKALEKIAKPAVADSVAVKGDGANGKLAPQDIADVIKFEPDGTGSLKVVLPADKLSEKLKAVFKPTEKPNKDATFDLGSGTPTVVPAVDGVIVDWEKTGGLIAVVLPKSDDRSVKAEYKKDPPKLTTEAANDMGIKEVVGEFTTGGFAADSGQNIKRTAELVNGAVVKPGAVFSLNGYTGPRGAAQGFVPAGIIENGAPGRAVGGGISQFATTLYNAYYFAGMMDVHHQEHSYFISRYPAGREATVFDGLIDVQFKNDSPKGVVIQTIWTPGNITVKLWGTKRYKIDFESGEKTDFVQPQTLHKPAGDQCHAGQGGQGFNIVTQRVFRDPNSGAEIKRESRKTHYDPSPTIVCDAKPDEKKPGQ
ncbi:hypothetical protein D5S17_33105 [Pseudonocardiaceae bacterium YIM PH 21723]|nr:hypothetical protein D5S17_33105 [Pseudonocardiaceae bacterium YIM PH 21723]